MVNCPICGGREVGKINVDQYYCWNCFVEYDCQNRIYQVDEDGSLVALGNGTQH